VSTMNSRHVFAAHNSNVDVQRAPGSDLVLVHDDDLFLLRRISDGAVSSITYRHY
jgi:hypothetical protein